MLGKQGKLQEREALVSVNFGRFGIGGAARLATPGQVDNAWSCERLQLFEDFCPWSHARCQRVCVSVPVLAVG